MKNAITTTDRILDCAAAVKAKARATVSAHRNLALSFLADAITGGAKRLIEASEQDVARAKKKGADEMTLSHMRLDYLAIGALAGRIRTMAAKEDPTDVAEEWVCENGLSVRKVNVPLGVLGAIAGDNPRRTIESAAQAIKTGNAMVILRSPLTPKTDKVFDELLSGAFACCGMSADTVQSIEYTPDTIRALITASGKVDALILLGNKKQNNYIRKNSTLPVIASDAGTSHIYVDENADVRAAARGVVESFLASSSLNTVLVNWMVSDDFLPILEGAAMEAGIELIADARVRSTLHGTEDYKEAHKKNADGRLLVLTVNSVEDAVKHIEKYGDGVCEGIYTPSGDVARYFSDAVDAGTITLNAPISRANGFDAGLGADVGLGADKLSGRGLFGLEKLTAIKYIVKR